MARTRVQRILASRAAVAVMSALPVPHAVMRGTLVRDNAKENRRDSWHRLRADSERERYQTVRAVTESYAATGFVLDVGCSQGILQEGLHYGRYLGIDSYQPSIDLAGAKADDRTRFLLADATSFVAEQPADAIVLNEVLYYFDDPLGLVRHYARQLAPDGALVISLFAHAWANRRLRAMIGIELERLSHQVVRSGHLAWAIDSYRPWQDGATGGG